MRLERVLHASFILKKEPKILVWNKKRLTHMTLSTKSNKILCTRITLLQIQCELIGFSSSCYRFIHWNHTYTQKSFWVPSIPHPIKLALSMDKTQKVVRIDQNKTLFQFQCEHMNETANSGYTHLFNQPHLIISYPKSNSYVLTLSFY